jgi:hypothetical protein
LEHDRGRESQDIGRRVSPLRECIVDELVLMQHRSIDTSNVCTCPLGRREYLGQKNSITHATCDHVVSFAVRRSLGREDERLLTGQHECVRCSLPQTERSLIEEEEVRRAATPEFASHVCNRLTGSSRHCRHKSTCCSSCTHACSMSHSCMH